jgi:hypothetical protein
MPMDKLLQIFTVKVNLLDSMVMENCLLLQEIFISQGRLYHTSTTNIFIESAYVHTEMSLVQKEAHFHS